jgi:hypothetical protein
VVGFAHRDPHVPQDIGYQEEGSEEDETGGSAAIEALGSIDKGWDLVVKHFVAIERCCPAS